jgi:hypothetical protein
MNIDLVYVRTVLVKYLIMRQFDNVGLNQKSLVDK